MGKYIVRRFLWMVLTLFVIAFITFCLMHLVPGGPWDKDKTLPPQIIENLNRKYGLDQPFLVQFKNYIFNALQGDLGISYVNQNRSVTEIIMGGFPVSAILGLVAFVLATLIGIPLGIAAALKQNSFVDYFAVIFATIFASIPNFVLGILLVVIFSVTLHWLPTNGLSSIKQIIMPAFALAALPAAYMARITRASMLDVTRQDYVRTARAKGLSERMVIIRHILRNAMIPVVTVAGPELAGLVTGSFIIENIFSIPGIGRLFIQSISNRDYGMIMGTVLFYAFAIAFINLAVDILYGIIDPRIRYD